MDAARDKPGPGLRDGEAAPPATADQADGLLGFDERVFVLASELIFYGQRGVTAEADVVLAQAGLGRAHYRVLHMVRHAPGITANGLLRRLGITTASLNRVMNDLIRAGLLVQETASGDRRQRLHRLTREGQALQARAFGAQCAAMARAFRTAGPQAVRGYLAVLHALVPPEGRGLLSEPLVEALDRLAAAGAGAPRAGDEQGL